MEDGGEHALNVLLVHNFYQQAGGEDEVFRSETALLTRFGHRVQTYTVSNDVIEHTPRIRAAVNTLWNRQVARELHKVVRDGGFEVVHFHNTFPVLSPAAYAGARAGGAAVVQTLHNYRLMCANALFYRDGHVCEDCLGRRVPWPAVRHRCYRDRRDASAVVAAMQVTHHTAGTYRRGVDAYIALTEFARGKFIAGGLPERRLHVKPNFYDPDPGLGQADGGYALFVGRLSPEKGVTTLLDAWRSLGAHLPLRILGDGPLAGEVARAAETSPGVTWLGRQGRAQVLEQMQNAAMLVLPSSCYEGLPMTLVEAYAVGLPVVGSNLGAMSVLIEHGRTGLHFRAENAADLAAQAAWLQAHEAERQVMRLQARHTFESTYGAERNHELLMGIYQTALTRTGKRRRNTKVI